MNGDDLNLNLLMFARPLYFFFLLSQCFCILVRKFFTAKCNRSRCGSPFETQPYNNSLYYLAGFQLVVFYRYY